MTEPSSRISTEGGSVSDHLYFYYMFIISASLFVLSDVLMLLTVGWLPPTYEKAFLIDLGTCCRHGLFSILCLLKWRLGRGNSRNKF